MSENRISIMSRFDTQAAMDIVTRSRGGFSYDTLARALILNVQSESSEALLEECQRFCLALEKRGMLRKCAHCTHPQDVYFEYVPH